MNISYITLKKIIIKIKALTSEQFSISRDVIIFIQTELNKSFGLIISEYLNSIKEFLETERLFDTKIVQTKIVQNYITQKEIKRKIEYFTNKFISKDIILFIQNELNQQFEIIIEEYFETKVKVFLERMIYRNRITLSLQDTEVIHID